MNKYRKWIIVIIILIILLVTNIISFSWKNQEGGACEYSASGFKIGNLVIFDTLDLKFGSEVGFNSICDDFSGTPTKTPKYLKYEIKKFLRKL